MRRLVCVGEGHGEDRALPRLCARVLYSLGTHDWYVDERAIRRPRSRLVDQTVQPRKRPPNIMGLDEVVALAKARRANAVLVTCDEDDDCAAAWGPAATRQICAQMSGAAVMVVREFETWILHDRGDFAPAYIEKKRDAKGLLDEAVGGYLPSVHQVEVVYTMNLDRVRALSDSFDKLVRALSLLCGVAAPPRPSFPLPK